MDITYKQELYITPNDLNAHLVVDGIIAKCKDDGVWYTVSEDTHGISIKWGGNVIHRITDIEIKNLPQADCPWK